MVDFSHLEALDVSAEHTARYAMHEITVEGRTPTLIVKPATDANKPYYNAKLKRAAKNQRVVLGGQITVGLLDESRDEDRELFAKYVVVGWEDLVDATGKDVPFTKRNCEDFVAALSNWVFDGVTQFAGTASNFTEEINVAAKAKNSQSD